MWKVRRAAACSSSLRKWCFTEKNVPRCSPGLGSSDSRAAFARRCFSRALLPGDATSYVKTSRGLSFSYRGFATRHDSASDLSESDEFEEPESSSSLKEIEDEPEETKEDEDEEEEEHEDVNSHEPVTVKSVEKSKSERRLTLAHSDKLEQELLARIFACKKDESMSSVLDKWKEEGKDLTVSMIVTVINRLKNSNRMAHALEMIEWITARSKGIAAAEKLFEELSAEEKTRPVYNALLTRYVFLHNVKKAEGLFEEMDKAGFLSQSPFALNLMMKLYKHKGDNAKFQEMLEKAKDVAVEPNIFTYNVMLDLKAKAGDVEGMEKIFEEMKLNPNAKPDGTSYFTLCKGYLKAGLTDKAEVSLLRMEVGPFRRTKATFEYMMLAYGQLGLISDVERMWQKCKMVPGDGFNSFLAFQRAMALAGEVQRVDSMFKHMDKWKRSKTVDLKRHNNLLLAYYKKGMKCEIKELEKKMNEMDLRVTLVDWEKEPIKMSKAAKAVVRKDKEKETAARKGLEEAVEKADVKAAESAFEKCKAGNMAKVGVWNKLLKAYVNAQVPAYGFLQRMKAEGVEANEETHSLLKKLQVEA
ncbi:hypothetical protein SELMODRAFT_406783 [Selaginella moellendorffii]|uniref:Pentacotripeptide-repeat region of PRORP domain-containing protein n=1 Tax=Selaginella moellendorffii TaxID=88036 RepID=D8R2X4_SELML|nr:pentatricopeptide repeat-containing protein At1g80270, mitochondrial [Selaginella moellendorffii]EFJ32841.1 hypothetical protein SELMODRAFT_406783 [Selaginella moellendorffii]|eukprot:XP_002965421.1 pentatricopeptide repeat-containing protein At1g80270, mitochondrial [Selaginella moellendorffii]